MSAMLHYVLMSPEDVTELTELRKLIGDPAAGGAAWKGVTRQEAIRQADAFYANAQRWAGDFEKVRDQRDDAVAESASLRESLDYRRGENERLRHEGETYRIKLGEATTEIQTWVDAFSEVCEQRDKASDEAREVRSCGQAAVREREALRASSVVMAVNYQGEAQLLRDEIERLRAQVLRQSGSVRADEALSKAMRHIRDHIAITFADLGE